MKKIIALISAAFVAVMLLGAPASATGNHNGPEISGKDVTLCHYAGSNNNGGSGKYTTITVDINGFLSGHKGHTNDIWPEVKYIKRISSSKWETVTVPAQGDQSRLAFKNCKKPDDDEPIAKPEPVYNDLCGTENDVFSVAPGRGYTVSNIVNEGNNMVITVTLEEDFKWADGSTNALRFVKPPFTDADCDLPETGGEAQYNYMLGAAGIAILLAAAAALTLTRKRN